MVFPIPDQLLCTMDSGGRTAIVFSCVPTEASTRLEWRAKNPSSHAWVMLVRNKQTNKHESVKGTGRVWSVWVKGRLEKASLGEVTGIRMHIINAQRKSDKSYVHKKTVVIPTESVCKMELHNSVSWVVCLAMMNKTVIIIPINLFQPALHLLSC